MAVQLDQALLEILACPCPEHAPLRAGTPDDPQADFLTCTACDRRFPVRDGIAVLLLEEATGGPDSGAPTTRPGEAADQPDGDPANG